MLNNRLTCKGIALAFVFSVPLVLGACSNEVNSEEFYQKLEEAKLEMNQMSPEQAIMIYDDILDGFLDGNTYEISRTEMVEDLRRTADSLSSQMKEMETAFEEIEQQFSQLDEASDLAAFRDVLNSIETSGARFEEFSEMERYAELEHYEKQVIQIIEEDLSNAYQEAFDQAIEVEDVAAAKNSQERLAELHDWFPNIVSEADLSTIGEEIEEIEDKYIRFPELISALDQSVHQDERGEVSVYGYQSDYETVDYYFQLDHDYAILADYISFDGRLIFSNGEVITSSDSEIIQFEDSVLKRLTYHIGKQSLSDLVRMNIDLPIASEDEIALDMDHSGKEQEIQVDGIRSIQSLHRPEWEISTDLFDAEINRLLVKDRSVEISGVITPHSDQELDTYSSLYIGETAEQAEINRGGIFSGAVTKELFAGTTSEFSYDYSFSGDLTEFHEFAILELFGHDFVLDLKTGEEQGFDDEVFIDLIEHDVDRSYRAHYHNDFTKGLKTQSGEWADIDSITKSGRSTSSFYLKNQFDRFTATVHVQEDTSGVDFGSTVVQFTDGEEVIYEIDIEEDHQGYVIDMDVSDLYEMEIITRSSRGSEGTQVVIFENAYLYE